MKQFKFNQNKELKDHSICLIHLKWNFIWKTHYLERMLQLYICSEECREYLQKLIFSCLQQNSCSSDNCSTVTWKCIGTTWQMITNTIPSEWSKFGEDGKENHIWPAYLVILTPYFDPSCCLIQMCICVCGLGENQMSYVGPKACIMLLLPSGYSKQLGSSFSNKQIPVVSDDGDPVRPH